MRQHNMKLPCTQLFSCRVMTDPQHPRRTAFLRTLLHFMTHVKPDANTNAADAYKRDVGASDQLLAPAACCVP